MKPHRQRIVRNTEECPMPALLDVVFLLLIFFVVTFRERIIDAIARVNMASATPKPSARPPPHFRISVLPDCRYGINNMELGLGDIQARLAELTDADKEAQAIIAVSKDARESDLVALLDVCERAKVQSRNLYVVTLKE